MKICLLLVTGSIAAIKAPELVRALQAKNFDVHCVLTKAACEFVTPRSLAAISNNPVMDNEWWKEKEMRPGILAEPKYEHIDFSKKADLLLVAPATADTIARLANGRANGLFEATVLASRAPLLIAPAMNCNMLVAEKTQKNIKELEKNGVKILPTKQGTLACGDEGKGKILETEMIGFFAQRAITPQKLQGKNVLVTLGATQEMLDPVRCLTNLSSGKMGYAIAVSAFLQGAEVIIIAGKNEVIQAGAGVAVSTCPTPLFKKIIPVISAQDMFQATKKEIDDCDYAFFVAAVCDFTPEKMEEEKLDSESFFAKASQDKKARMTLPLIKTSDIAAKMGRQKKAHQQFFGFALQTGGQKEAEKKAQKKMEEKNLDGIFLNAPANLGTEKGEIFFLRKGKETIKISGEKSEIAEEILESLS